MKRYYVENGEIYDRHTDKPVTLDENFDAFEGTQLCCSLLNSYHDNQEQLVESEQRLRNLVNAYFHNNVGENVFNQMIYARDRFKLLDETPEAGLTQLEQWRAAFQARHPSVTESDWDAELQCYRFTNNQRRWEQWQKLQKQMELFGMGMPAFQRYDTKPADTI